ncbi:MAG: Tn3 family transposase [Nostoc sp. RI_552]|nr:Tn3 family transposase [Nostoc sp. RI_552]
MITENDAVEQEKRFKYLDLVPGAVILQNRVDMSLVIQALTTEGYPVSHPLVAALSPFVTLHLKISCTFYSHEGEKFN